MMYKMSFSISYFPAIISDKRDLQSNIYVKLEVAWNRYGIITPTYGNDPQTWPDSTILPYEEAVQIVLKRPQSLIIFTKHLCGNLLPLTSLDYCIIPPFSSFRIVRNALGVGVLRKLTKLLRHYIPYVVSVARGLLQSIPRQ